MEQHPSKLRVSNKCVCASHAHLHHNQLGVSLDPDVLHAAYQRCLQASHERCVLRIVVGLAAQVFADAQKLHIRSPSPGAKTVILMQPFGAFPGCSAAHAAAGPWLHGSCRLALLKLPSLRKSSIQENYFTPREKCCGERLDHLLIGFTVENCSSPSCAWVISGPSIKFLWQCTIRQNKIRKLSYCCLV